LRLVSGGQFVGHAFKPKLAEIGPSCKPVWRVLFVLLNQIVEFDDELVLTRRLSTT
jgi:hypothetical protein